MSSFSISRRLWHVLFTSKFTVSRIAYEKIYTSEKEARCCIKPFWYCFFWHTLLTCEMPYAFSLCALYCLHIDIFISHWHIFHSHSTFMKLLGATDWPWGHTPALVFWFLLLFSLFFCKYTFSSANRVRQHWTRAPWFSWWGVLSTQAEGLMDLGNPFRFGGEERACQLLFLWLCHSPQGHKTHEDDKRIEPTDSYFLRVMSII